MTRLFRALAVACIACVLPLTVGAAGQQQGQPVTTPRLELIEQNFAIEADGTIELTYRLTGVEDDALEFVPTVAPDTIPADTIPADTVPVDTVPTGTDPADVIPRVTTPAEPVVAPITLTIEVINFAPLTDAADIADVVGSDVSPDAFSTVIDGVAFTDVRSLATVQADGSIVIELEIPTDVVTSVEERLQFERAGFYPLRTELLVGEPGSDDVVATAGTIIQRLPAPSDPDGTAVREPPPFDFSIITAIPSPGPNATAGEAAAAGAAFDEALVLAGSLTAPVTIEVAPRIVAEATATPNDAERVTAALEGDELVALPIAPLDVSSAVAAGRQDAFAALLRAGEDLLSEAVPTPSRRDVWITTAPLSAAGAQELRDLGVRFVVMPTDIYRETVATSLPATDLFVESGLPDGATLPVLIVDQIANELTPDAADQILERATATEWAVQALAEILLDQRTDDEIDGSSAWSAPERSIVLTTPTLMPPDVRLLLDLERMVATTPSARFTPASELIGVTDVQLDDGQPVTIDLPEVAGPSLAERIELIDRTALTMLSAASMLADDDARPAQWSEDLNALISTGYSDVQVEAATTALAAEAAELKQAVVLPDPITFTLTGRNGPIEIRLGNTSDEPLKVLLELSSNKVEFPDGNQVVSLRPNDETSVIVPVEARSNGTSSIELTVSTPAGEPLGEPVTLTSRVTGFTGLGQVLMGGMMLVLFTWWFAHWRASRRAAASGGGRGRHPTGRELGSDA